MLYFIIDLLTLNKSKRSILNTCYLFMLGYLGDHAILAADRFALVNSLISPNLT